MQALGGPDVDREIVGRHDRRGLGAKELAPAQPGSSGRSRDTLPAEQVSDRGRRYRVAELEQLAPYPYLAPTWILLGQAQDHQAALLWHPRSPRAAAPAVGRPLPTD